jgi:hypothetical protein
MNQATAPLAIVADGRARVRLSAAMCALTAAAAVLIGAPPASVAQSPPRLDVAHEVFAGSELERYLRVMQLRGDGREQPWSQRALSAREVGNSFGDAEAHPWAARFSFSGDTAGGGWGWVRPRANAIFNSAFPYGGNDGAVWAGRGLTTAVSGGAWVRFGPLTGVIAPTAFVAQNAGFDMAPPGATDDPFADPRFPNAIDHPQRFGNGAYWRVDPGQSYLRVDLPVVALGVSTANQVWGPGNDYPIILGNNAAGFPHLFLGSSEPLDIYIGNLHGRMVWGMLDQSSHSPVRAGETRRFMAGLVGGFMPGWVPGLEIGASRFFHLPWPTQGFSLEHFLKPLEGLLKADLVGDGLEGGSDQGNQLASVFARWVVPRAGFEVYGEFAREDHSLNLRDLLLEPDHNSAYMLGFQRAWTGSAARWLALRGEVVNAEISHLYRVRSQSPFYVHTWTPQGHTVRGQILGSPAAYGGSGATIALEGYQRQGQASIAWSRTLRDRRGSYWETGTVETEAADVIHSLGAGATLFRGPLDLRGGVVAAWELNRFFEDDAFNLSAEMGVRWSP